MQGRLSKNKKKLTLNLQMWNLPKYQSWTGVQGPWIQSLKECLNKEKKPRHWRQQRCSRHNMNDLKINADPITNVYRC